jgi:hypothetical protein
LEAFRAMTESEQCAYLPKRFWLRWPIVRHRRAAAVAAIGRRGMH